MIKFDPSKPIVREAKEKAPFEYMNDGELVTENIRVLYFAQTVKQARDRHDRLAALAADNPEAIYWDSEELKDIVAELPDLTNGNGKPHKITLEFLESLSTKNLKAIKKVIMEDSNPKAEPDKLPSGTSPAEN